MRIMKEVKKKVKKKGEKEVDFLKRLRYTQIVVYEKKAEYPLSP